MQLTTKPIRCWMVALSALLLLSVGSELFLRFSTTAVLKTQAQAMVAGGLLMLAWSRWETRCTVLKIGTVFFFAAYLASAALRFPGLLKEPAPLESSLILFFSLKVVLVVSLVLLLLVLLRHLYRGARKVLST